MLLFIFHRESTWEKSNYKGEFATLCCPKMIWKWMKNIYFLSSSSLPYFGDSNAWVFWKNLYFYELKPFKQRQRYHFSKRVLPASMKIVLFPSIFTNNGRYSISHQYPVHLYILQRVQYLFSKGNFSTQTIPPSSFLSKHAAFPYWHHMSRLA